MKEGGGHAEGRPLRPIAILVELSFLRKEEIDKKRKKKERKRSNISVKKPKERTGRRN